MNCSDFLHIFSYINSTDLIAYIALVLAFFAFEWNVNRGYKSWKYLFQSLREEFLAQESWLKKGYKKETYLDKKSFYPGKIIWPLSFESLSEIIRRGPAEFPFVSVEFISQLNIFNERVKAFNSILDYIQRTNSANSQLSQNLIDKLNYLGVSNDHVDFLDFRGEVEKLELTEKDLYLLAQRNRFLNEVVHVYIISDSSSTCGLNNLYNKILLNLEDIIKNFDNRKPVFVKYKWSLLIISVPVFILIQILFGNI